MEPVVVAEDAVHIGDDSQYDGAEDSTTHVIKDQSDVKREQESGSNSVGSPLVDSLKSTAKSVTRLLPASLRGLKDNAEGEVLPASDEGIDTVVEKEAVKFQSKIGEDPSRADEVMEEFSLRGTITDVTAEGWSGVERSSEEATKDQAQSESQSTSVESEGETPKSGDPNLSMQARRFASHIIAEPEILEEDSNTRIRPSGYVADGPFVRSSSKGTNEDTSVVNSVDAHVYSVSGNIDIAAIAAIAERPAAFEPREDPLLEPSGDMEIGSPVRNEDDKFFSNTDNSIGLTRRKPRSLLTGRKDDSSVVTFVGAHVSRSSESIDIAAIAERPDAFEPQNDSLSGESGDLEFESQLQNEDADSVSKADSWNDLRREKRSELRSGYDPELEDEYNDVSSASSREADHGTDLWKTRRSQLEEGWEEVASSSDLEGKTSFPETMQRRGVYRMPGSDAEGEDNGGENPPQVLVQPAGFVVRTIEFQLNLIVHMIAIGIWLVNFTLSTISHPISRTVEVKDKVTSVTAGAANQVLEVFSSLGSGILQTGPTVSKLSKTTFWGCLGVAYVMCMLGLLLIPALFVDIIIVNSMVEKPLAIRQALDFDFTQPRPIALLPLFPPKEIERIKNLPPDKVVRTRVIPVGSKFHVTVILTLPESDYNMKLGMFQMTAELLSARDQVILRSSKPCRLRYRSFPIQLVNTLVYAVPHLFGLSAEAQTIEIRLLEAQEKAVPTASVRILIEPKASFRDEGGVPEIYEAAVRLDSTFSWPRALLSSWKWLFFLWNGICLFLFEVAIVLCCCRQVLIPTFGRKPVAQEEIVLGEVKDSSATREASRNMRSSRKGRSNKRVYFEDDIPESGYSRLEEYKDT